MTKEKPVYFAFYVDEWIGGTRHLDHVARSCYLELLLFQFEHGHIPTEPTTRMQLCGISEVGTWERVWRHIGDKFEVGNDGLYRNRKMNDQREKARKRYMSAAERGRMGWLAKASSAKAQLKPSSTIQNHSNQRKKPEQKQKPERGGFAPPSLDQVSAYCLERENGLDPETFVDYYQAQGWKLANGRVMKDWKAAVRTWEKRNTAPIRKVGDF